MKAVYASTVNHADPLAALAVGEQPEPQARPFWSTVSVRAVTVNHHDVWSLQGVGLAAEQTPMILGTDAVGILDEDIPGKHGLKAGSEVVLYTFVGTDGAGVAPGERRTILSEKYPGTMAEKTSVPSANVFAKPANLTTAEAAALGTSWLTAYSLLFDAAGIKPGDSVLIQGAGGGVSTAAIQLAHAAGLEVFVTSRDADKRSKALKLRRERRAGDRCPPAAQGRCGDRIRGRGYLEPFDEIRAPRRHHRHLRRHHRRPAWCGAHATVLPGHPCAGLHHGFARGFRTIAALRGARQSASGDRLRGQRSGRRARGLRQDDCR